MILIPQRLFNDKNVRTLMQDGNTCILHKELPEALIGREAYVSNHVISVVLAGEQRIKTYDDNVIHVRAGELVFLPRGVYYVTDLKPAADNFRSLLFYFDDEQIHAFLQHSRVMEADHQAAPDHLKFEQFPAISTFVQSFLDIYGNGRHGKQFLQPKLLELLHLLNAQSNDKAFAEFLFRLSLPRKRNIRTFMEANYDKPLKMEDYAYLTGRSASTFRRDFKAQFRTTPQQWVKDQRLNKAHQLATNQEMPVTEMAFEVGYDNVSYFIREFRNRTGLSPKQFMLRQHRNNLS
ncbi:AraC family transcriptional regulator [Neolewinella persica]|uniref:AraC family transcriptional regulator n=1 Tax=Neolewinella persica TaxID=70998 RepID=UPI0003624EF9|nr:AraC family transcriptional regulator [Neolewinella persica]